MLVHTTELLDITISDTQLVFPWSTIDSFKNIGDDYAHYNAMKFLMNAFNLKCEQKVDIKL